MAGGPTLGIDGHEVNWKSNDGIVPTQNIDGPTNAGTSYSPARFEPIATATDGWGSVDLL